MLQENRRNFNSIRQARQQGHQSGDPISRIPLPRKCLILDQPNAGAQVQGGQYHRSIWASWADFLIMCFFNYLYFSII